LHRDLCRISSSLRSETVCQSNELKSGIADNGADDDFHQGNRDFQAIGESGGQDGGEKPECRDKINRSIR